MYSRENGNFSVTGVRFRRAEMKCNVPSNVCTMAEKKKSQISYRERFITRPHPAAFIITRFQLDSSSTFTYVVYPHSGLDDTNHHLPSSSFCNYSTAYKCISVLEVLSIIAAA